MHRKGFPVHASMNSLRNAARTTQCGPTCALLNKTVCDIKHLVYLQHWNSPVLTTQERLLGSRVPYSSIEKTNRLYRNILEQRQLKRLLSTSLSSNICPLNASSATATTPGSLTSPPSSRRIHTAGTMAKSKFEYVKQFEVDDPCLQNCWIVVRIDGKAFHKFTDSHHYMKPNDERGLGLMTRAAQIVMNEFNEIVLAYGQSDEYSFVFHKNCKVYNRRGSKIMTNVVSLFASAFTLYWPRYFSTQELQYPPAFDARVVLYPSEENLKDYLSWRQADCHINNLYNTCFWKLVQEKGLAPAQAEARLKGTLSSDKNELLFSEFDTNYNNLPELYRKGSVLIRPRDADSASPERNSTNNARGHGTYSKANRKPTSVVLHLDIIGKKFWDDYPHILNPKL